MKKVLSILIVLIMALFAIFASGCGTLDDETANAIDDDVYEIYEMLKSEWKGADTIDDIAKPLMTWARKNGIAFSNIDGDNFMMSLDATDDYANAQTTIIQCSISTSNYRSKSQAAAVAMAALKNSEEHGSVKLLFTASGKQGNYYGARKLKTNVLSCDNFISLDYWAEPSLFTGSAMSADFVISKNLSKDETSGNKAYKISITGLEGGDSSDRTRKHANPITELGDLLSGCKSSGMAIEISNFSGGSSAGNYPSSAEVTVSINENDETKLINRIKDTREDFLSKYRKGENSVEYTYKEVSVPDMSYTEDDAARILSLLHTLDDGVYEPSTEDSSDSGDDDPVAISNVGYIRTNGTVKVGVKGRSIDPSVLTDMQTSYTDTAKLNDFTLKRTATFPLWQFEESCDLADRYLVAAKQFGVDMETDWTFNENECAIFYDKKPSMDIICIGTNITDGYDVAKSLVVYLSSLGSK